MRNRVLKSVAVALALAAAAVPLAQATGSEAGNKSDYPELFGHATDLDDGYKSGYPQLHAIHTYKATTSRTARSYDGDTVRVPPALRRTSLTDPECRPRLPLERRGDRRRNSSPGDPPLRLLAPSYSAAATAGSPLEPGPPPREGSGVQRPGFSS